MDADLRCVEGSRIAIAIPPVDDDAEGRRECGRRVGDRVEEAERVSGREAKGKSRKASEEVKGEEVGSGAFEGLLAAVSVCAVVVAGSGEEVSSSSPVIVIVDVVVFFFFFFFHRDSFSINCSAPIANK